MTKARALQFKREADRRLALRLVSENRREALRKKLKPSLNKREKVMARFYGISTNDYKPIMVEHAVVDRIMSEQGQCGFIVVSAYRNDEPQEVVDKHSCELVSTLKRSGYAYLPTYGRNANAAVGENKDYVPAFIVFNHNSNMLYHAGDFSVLEEFGKALAERYGQDGFLCKCPNEAAVYFGRDGKSDELGRRWTDDMDPVFVNPIPCTLVERMRRKGEIMLY